MKPEQEEKNAFLSSMNSYLGIMKHYKTFNLRKKMLFKKLSGCWWNYVYLSEGISKFAVKRRYSKPGSLKINQETVDIIPINFLCSDNRKILNQKRKT